MIYIFVAILSLILGIAIGVHRNMTQTAQVNQEVIKKNAQLEKEYEEKKIRLETQYQADLKTWESRKAKDDQVLKTYYEDKKELIDQQLAVEFEKENEKLALKIEDLKQNKLSELDKSIEEIADIFTLKMDDWEHEISHLGAQISELRAKRNSIIEAAKHEEEIRAQSDFYKLNLPEDDIHDYWELKKLENKLNKKDVLNKLIYKTYFEKPYTDLIGRVIGAGRHTGIYKITNINNQKVYIGQAVDISERWKQHIKRGIGAEPATQNKLYPAMKDEGVWNFTFEIIEECNKESLNEREQYYQGVFGAKEFGYSIK